jgi:triacylglycerol lipase
VTAFVAVRLRYVRRALAKARAEREAPRLPSGAAVERTDGAPRRLTLPELVRARHAPLVVLTKPPPTRHPIVLAHGYLGFASVGLRQARREYFVGVRERLEALGYTVHLARLSPTGSVSLRAAQLARQIESIRAERVNIIAHSMGGLDARWAIANRLDETKDVLSLVTIGTPHRGSEVADAIANRRPPLFSALPRFVIDQLKELGPALEDLTTERGAIFDDTTPDRLGPDPHAITYLEIAGDASKATKSLLFDVAAMLGDITGQPNDGVVTRASATRKGRGLFAVWPFDHGGEIGWTLDVFFRPRRHLPFYDAIVDELRRHHGDR